ncbi:MAG TPA: DUF2721 domain-containing protein [Candidatus Kapabacteria bacterium]|nr:DUF2721 domain-containing protein [Candidatus Kapabacteria bacterium]
MQLEISIVSLIQSMLAPGVMINACGLLLLGMNNKYSAIVNRIRLLNDEKRKFYDVAGSNEMDFSDEIHLRSISIQLEKLLLRFKLVRNAVVCYSLAIAVFVINSFFIGINSFAESLFLIRGSVILFIMGMILVLIGAFFAADESIRGYQIIDFEIKSHE